MKKDFTAEIIYLPEVYEIAYEVSKQITEGSGSFDIIIAIARGGLTPARIICDFLNISVLTTLQITHYKGGAREKEEVEITDPIGVDIKGNNVLIVDDINDSGETLKSAYEHVRTLEPSKVKTAVLHEKDNTCYNAHFTGKILRKWKWIIYQWAVTEDLLEFLRRDDMLCSGELRAIRHLSEKYALEIDSELYNKVIAMKQNYFPGQGGSLVYELF